MRIEVPGLVLLMALQAQTQPAVPVAHIGDRLEVLDDAGRTIEVLPFKFAGFLGFSINRGTSVAVGVRGHCDGMGGRGDLYLVRYASAFRRAPAMAHSSGFQPYKG